MKKYKITAELTYCVTVERIVEADSIQEAEDYMLDTLQRENFEIVAEQDPYSLGASIVDSDECKDGNCTEVEVLM